MTERVIIDSRRFGRIEATPDDLLECDGIPGFPSARRLLLLRHDQKSLFGWLLCADDPDLAFVVTDPRQFFPDYRPSLPARQVEHLGAKGGEELELLAIADVRSGEIHLNLAAPVLVNPERRRAAQVILEGQEHSVREPVVATSPEVASE